jgi:hypothetical protein
MRWERKEYKKNEGRKSGVEREPQREEKGRKKI